MMNKTIFTSLVMVLLGAASYGVLATFVKLAYLDGYSISEILLSQYILGTLVMAVIFYILRNADRIPSVMTTKKSKWVLILGGSTYGITGYFYYLSLQYIPVSAAVVLLMQTVWLGVVVEAIQHKTMPSRPKIIAIAVVLLGTILATNVITDLKQLNLKGIFWGISSAIAYTAALYISNNNKSKLHPIYKSLMMLLGSTAFILIIGALLINKSFDVSIFWKWGLLLALFGSILPPVLLNKGMPEIGLGLGTLLIAVEIPVSLFMAKFLLMEVLSLYQWLGVTLILVSVFLINRHNIKKDINRLI